MSADLVSEGQPTTLHVSQSFKGSKICIRIPDFFKTTVELPSTQVPLVLLHTLHAALRLHTADGSEFRGPSMSSASPKTKFNIENR